MMENRLDRDTPLKFDMTFFSSWGRVEGEAGGGGGGGIVTLKHLSLLKRKYGDLAINPRCVRFMFAFSQLSTIIVC